MSDRVISLPTVSKSHLVGLAQREETQQQAEESELVSESHLVPLCPSDWSIKSDLKLNIDQIIVLYFSVTLGR